MTSAAVARAESAFVIARDRWGDLVVARHRGEPLQASATIPGLAAAYREARAAFVAALDAAGAAGSGPGAAGAAPEVRAMAGALAGLDEWEPVEEPGMAAEARGAETDLRRATLDTYAAAASNVDVGDGRTDRLGVLARLARTGDRTRRRELFLALRPVWAAIDGGGGPTSPYRRLLAAGVERWRREGSPIAANAAALGIEPGTIATRFRRILHAWRDAVAGPAGEVEPWDHHWLGGATARQLDGAVGIDRLRPVNDAHATSLGAAVDALGIRYDIEPRPGRPEIPVAFTVARRWPTHTAAGWEPGEPWVFATYRDGGIDDLAELVHETGHALQYAAIRTRPALADAGPAQAAWWEAFADVLGWDVHEPAFQARHLGRAVTLADSRRGRHAGVVLDVAWSLFELELEARPDRRPSDVWAELTERDLGIVGHPELAWWAMRGQLVDSPGYMANYGLGAIVTAAVRRELARRRGPWWEAPDPGWYAAVSEDLLRFGAEREPAGVLEAFLGGPVSEAALLEDLALAG